MNEAFPRCAVPGSSCRLLQLEAPGARPVWAVLDAAGTRHFTGEITMHGLPTVRAWFNGGELYYAERDGDAPLADRLLAMGVVTEADLAAGSVQLGAVAHLGRLFDRVPDLDRDRVELALEILTGEVVGEIADHVADEITIASYRHHSSGVVKWQKRPTVVISQVAASDDPGTGVTEVIASAPARVRPATAAAPGSAADLAPTTEDAEIVAAFEAEVAASLAASEVEPPAAPAAPAAPPAPSAPATGWDAPAPTGAPVEAENEAPVDARIDARIEARIVAAVERIDETDEPTNASAVTTPPPAPPLAPPAVELRAADAADAAAPDLDTSAAEAASTTEPTLAVVEAAAAPTPTTIGDLPGFDLSFGDLRAELEAELRAQFGDTAPEQPLAPPVTGTTGTTDTTDTIDTIDTIDTSGIRPTLGEPSWQIDDRVEWQVDEPAAAVASAAMESPTGGGPVVEFDLDDILRQVGSGDPSGHGSELGSGHHADPSRIGLDPADADDDVRAAVRAALVEIEAATRSAGNDEIPSILMQAALADSEPGLAPSVDSWVQASLDHDLAASPATGAPEASPETPTPLSLRPVLPGVAPTLANDPADGGDTQRPADPPSQEMPSTGGLRRTIGIRKPS